MERPNHQSASAAKFQRYDRRKKAEGAHPVRVYLTSEQLEIIDSKGITVGGKHSRPACLVACLEELQALRELVKRQSGSPDLFSYGSKEAPPRHQRS